ncbi:MAG: hypothetical protein LBN29_03775 [Mediterranea sp.]|jgi:hypothetical protein|nr:hypothetical protein [Mediterranea sp.]
MSETKTDSRLPNLFRKAVEATPDITRGYQEGLQALGKGKSKIQATDTRKLKGSVDIDSCTEKLYPESSRWDYTIGHDQSVYFIEIHPASTSDVSTMLKKLEWLKAWLKDKAPELEKLKARENPYVWLASGRVNILSGSKWQRQLAQKGLVPPREKLKL